MCFHLWFCILCVEFAVYTTVTDLPYKIYLVISYNAGYEFCPISYKVDVAVHVIYQDKKICFWFVRLSHWIRFLTANHEVAGLNPGTFTILKVDYFWNGVNPTSRKIG